MAKSKRWCKENAEAGTGVKLPNLWKQDYDGESPPGPVYFV